MNDSDRYYGDSVPVSSLSTDDLRFLNNEEALEDSAQVGLSLVEYCSDNVLIFEPSSSDTSSPRHRSCSWKMTMPCIPTTLLGSTMVVLMLELDLRICESSTHISSGEPSQVVVSIHTLDPSHFEPTN